MNCTHFWCNKWSSRLDYVRLITNSDLSVITDFQTISSDILSSYPLTWPMHFQYIAETFAAATWVEWIQKYEYGVSFNM